MPAIIEFPPLVQDAVDQFGTVFANAPERRHFAEYLTGLLMAEKKTVSGINAEFAQTTDQSCLNRWITEVDWDVGKLNERQLVWLQEARLLAALKRSDEAERAQRKFFQVTLASIGDAVTVTNPEGSVTFLIRVAEDITGWTTAVATGKPLPEMFHIEDEKTRQPVENPVGVHCHDIAYIFLCKILGNLTNIL